MDENVNLSNVVALKKSVRSLKKKLSILSRNSKAKDIEGHSQGPENTGIYLRDYRIIKYLQGRKPARSQANPDHNTCFARLALSRFLNGEKLFKNPKLIKFQKKELQEVLESQGISSKKYKSPNENRQETEGEDRGKETKTDREDDNFEDGEDVENEQTDIDFDKNLDFEHRIIVPMDERLRKKNMPMFWNAYRQKLKIHPPPYDEIGPPSYIQSLTHPIVIFSVRKEVVLRDDDDVKKTSTIMQHKYDKIPPEEVIEKIAQKREYIKLFTKILNEFDKQLENITFAFGENNLFSEPEKLILDHYEGKAKLDLHLEKMDLNLLKIEKDRNNFLKEVVFGRQNVDMRDQLAKYMKIGIKLAQLYNDVMIAGSYDS